MGQDVGQTTYEGTTAEDQDASCCAACEAEPACEFWVRATDNSALLQLNMVYYCY